MSGEGRVPEPGALGLWGAPGGWGGGRRVPPGLLGGCIVPPPPPPVGFGKRLPVAGVAADELESLPLPN